jgi:sugar-specific transcriptional regulator TrmB
MLKSKNQRIKELQEENGRLKEEVATLKEQICKCKAPKKETKVDKVVTPPPVRSQGKVISKRDFLNL